MFSPKSLLLIASGIVGIITLTLFGVSVYEIGHTRSVGAINNTRYVGIVPTYLSGAGISSSATTISILSLTIKQTGQALQMGDFGTVGYITLEPGSAARQEFASFTGITQNANGTAVLTGVSRGLSTIYPYTASTTQQFAHGGGTTLIVSNSPPFYNTFANQNNDATISGLYTFQSWTLPRVSASTTDAQVSASTSTLATVNYVNGVSIAGAANATAGVRGIVQLATASDASSTVALGGGSTGASLVPATNLISATPAASIIAMTQSTGKLLQGFWDLTASFIWTGAHTFNSTATFNATTTAASGVHTMGANLFYTALASTTITGAGTPQPVYATTTGALILSDANVNYDSQFLGFAVSSALNGGSTTVQVEGVVPGFTGLTKGSRYYVQDAVGTIGTTIGTNEIIVGTAVSSTEIYLEKNPNGVWQYLGSTSGVAATVPSIARFFVVDAVLTDECGAAAQNTDNARLIIARQGATSATYAFAGFCSASAVSDIVFTAALSGNVVNTSSSGADTPGLTATVYMYR